MEILSGVFVMRNPFELSETYLFADGARGNGRAVSVQVTHLGDCVTANTHPHKYAAAELKAFGESESHPLYICPAERLNFRKFKLLRVEWDKTGQPLKEFVHCAVAGVRRRVAELAGHQSERTFALIFQVFLELTNISSQVSREFGCRGSECRRFRPRISPQCYSWRLKRGIGVPGPTYGWRVGPRRDQSPPMHGRSFPIAIRGVPMRPTGRRCDVWSRRQKLPLPHSSFAPIPRPTLTAWH